jgi:hypothetical protein
MSLVERRTRRSENPAEALAMCLDACRARGGFDAVVIADEKGRVVGASSAESVAPFELAASLITRGRRPAKLASVLFQATGRPHFAGAIGGGRDAFARLTEAVRGARRILAVAVAT